MDKPKKTLSFKIIAVGAQPEWLDILAKDLSASEFQLQAADHLEQLSAALKEGLPDVLVLAPDFHGLDPFMLCSRLSKAGVAVLMISETPTRDVLVRAAKHGAMDFLVVPLQSRIVADKMNRVLVKIGKMAPPEGVGRSIDFGLAKSPYDKAKVVIQKVTEILALPFAVVKIIQLCNDPSASAKDLEKPVHSDPAIAAMIMQRANSAAFASIGRTTSVQRAVMRIGLRATRNIASSFSVFKLFSKEEKSFGFNRISFWAHSLATGICSHTLATMLKYPQPEDAFLAGLLHDIGKMVLDDFLNEEFDKVLRISNQDEVPIRVAEQSVFEANHAYFGSKIASSWGFPSVIADGIADHHQYQKVAEKTGEQSIGAVVCMGNQMAKALLAGSGGDLIAEREAAPLWKRIPSGVSWGETIKKVIAEVKAFAEILEIPPEQFQVDLPQESLGKAGILAPKGSNYGSLLEIAMVRQGYQPVLFSSPDDQQMKEKDLSLVVADLTSVEEEGRAQQFRQRISSLQDRNIILPHTDEKNRPLNLDFFRLESQVRGLQGETPPAAGAGPNPSPEPGPKV